MTIEEINKIAKEFAESICPESDYPNDEDGIGIKEREMDIQIYYDDAKFFLEWLSKNYVICKKYTIKKEYEKYSHEWFNSFHDDDKEPRQLLERLFGKDILKNNKVK